MRIYVAGALSSKEQADRSPSKVVTDYIQNINRMCRVASVLRRKGHFPYVPALDFLLGVIAGDWEEEDYRGLGAEFLKVCDAILITSSSWGVDMERELAGKWGLRVYYNIEDIPDAKSRLL